MKFFKTKFAAYLSDCMLALLLTASLCLAVFPWLGLSITWPQCLVFVLINLGLVFVFSRRWWVFLVVIIPTALVGFIISSVLGTNAYVLHHLAGFLNWGLNGFNPDSVYTLPVLLFGAQLMLALPFAGVSLLFVRKLYTFALLAPCTIGLVVWVYFSNRLVFFPILALTLLLNFMCLAKTNTRRINKGRADAEKINAALLPVTAFILVGLVLLFVYAVVPPKDGDWRSKGFVNIVEDIGDYLRHGGSANGLVQSEFSLAKTGFSPLQDRLGGNVTADKTLVMRVSTDTPTYLTGTIYDTYDGDNWTNTQLQRRYRFSSLVWRTKRNEVLMTDNPSGGRKAEALYHHLTKTADYNIAYSEKGQTIFYAGQISTIKSRKLDVTDIFFNNKPELFLLNPKSYLNYSFSARVFDISALDFEQNMLALEALTLTQTDPYMASVKASYLALPQNLPESVYNTASEVTKDCTTPFETAASLQHWLQQNCSYTLSPGAPPQDKDFVTSFLAAKKGYCVYFASAMTVMARCQGLPARYVTGYALKKDPNSPSDKAYVATHAEAHAWTEIYFNGIGWVPFDATGWQFSDVAVVAETNTHPPHPSQYYNQSAAIVPNGTAGNDTETPRRFSGVFFTLILGGLLLALVALLSVIRLASVLRSPDGYYQRLVRLYPDVSCCMDAGYRRIIRQVGFLGLSLQAGDTITQFAQRVDAVLETDTMSKICESVINLRFAQNTPTSTEMKELCRFSANLEKQLREKLGFAAYLWRRLIIGK